MSSSETQDNFVFWKPEVNERGTFKIIVTCLSTLGICLWSALHLSIPEERRSWKKVLAVKLGWMILGFFLPELLIWNATEQRRQAVHLRDKVNAHFKLVETRRPWYQRWFRWSSNATVEKDIDEERTLIKGSSDASDSKSPCPDNANRKGAEKTQITSEKPTINLASNLPFPRNKVGRHQWTLAHGFYAVMGGYATYDRSGKLRILKGSFVEDLLKRNPKLVPDLSKSTILDRSKADGLAKALLFTQVGWFCVSCFNRLAQHYPLTLLEVSALAHALCSMTVYILWWDKPLNIEEPLIIYESSVLQKYKLPLRTGNWFDIEGGQGRGLKGLRAMIVGISLIYGAPHLLAWNSAFATHTEQLLWRTASCIVVSCGIVALVLYSIASFIEDLGSADGVGTFASAMFFLSAIAYFSANLYLIAASFRQLFRLPPNAFQTAAWSNYFPHFS